MAIAITAGRTCIFRKETFLFPPARCRLSQLVTTLGEHIPRAEGESRSRCPSRGGVSPVYEIVGLLSLEVFALRIYFTPSSRSAQSFLFRVALRTLRSLRLTIFHCRSNKDGAGRSISLGAAPPARWHIPQPKVVRNADALAGVLSQLVTTLGERASRSFESCEIMEFINAGCILLRPDARCALLPDPDQPGGGAGRPHLDALGDYGHFFR